MFIYPLETMFFLCFFSVESAIYTYFNQIECVFSVY